MNNEQLEALNVLEEEKNISKDTLLEAIENSLVTACKNHFGKSDNIKVNIDPETCEFHVYQEKTVVEEVEDPCLEISLLSSWQDRCDQIQIRGVEAVSSTASVYRKTGNGNLRDASV